MYMIGSIRIVKKIWSSDLLKVSQEYSLVSFYMQCYKCPNWNKRNTSNLNLCFGIIPLKEKYNVNRFPGVLRSYYHSRHSQKKVTCRTKRENRNHRDERDEMTVVQLDRHNNSPHTFPTLAHYGLGRLATCTLRLWISAEGCMPDKQRSRTAFVTVVGTKSIMRAPTLCPCTPMLLVSLRGPWVLLQTPLT